MLQINYFRSMRYYEKSSQLSTQFHAYFLLSLILFLFDRTIHAKYNYSLRTICYEFRIYNSINNSRIISNLCVIILQFFPTIVSLTKVYWIRLNRYINYTINVHGTQVY